MPKTYYDSELTGAQIEDALEAIHGVVTPSNNGKVLCIVNGTISAKSASEWGHGAVLEPLSVTANGDYTPPTGTDGFDSVHVAVPGATLTTKSITQNGTYNASQDNADGYSSVTVNVSGGGSAVIQPLSVTQNGTYTPPSGVDGYAPVTVNVPSGGVDKIGYSNVTFSNTETDSNIGDPATNKITTALTAKGTQQVICTSNAVDLTGKEFIIVSADSLGVNSNVSNAVIFGVSQSIPASFSDAVSAATVSVRSGNRSRSAYSAVIDVRGLTGNYYIYYAASLNYSQSGFIDATFEMLLI